MRELRDLIREARSQGSEAKGHTLALQEVKASLTTRYLGPFPQYMPDIIAVVGGAKEKLVICCDFPAYGRFADPTRWLEYEQAIERKIHSGIRVSLTCLDADCRVKFNSEQFSKEIGEWDDWKRSKLGEASLKELIDYYGDRGETIDTLSRERFQELLEKSDQRMLAGPFGRAERREIHDLMPIYFWLADGRSAVFSIPSFAGKVTEYGFITFDQKLISAFEEMVGRYHGADA